MTQDEIAKVFFDTFSGYKNIITPEIIKYGIVGERGTILYEISKGKGMYGEKVFGVTVITIGGEKRGELSRGGFLKLSQAEAYVANLDEFLSS